MVHPALPDDVRARVEATVTPRPHHLASWLLPARASLEERLRHVDSPFVFFRRAIASSTDFPQDAVDRLAADTDQRVLLDLAAHHDTVPGDVLARLVPEVGKAKWRLAKHPALRPEPFAASDDSQLRIFAALSPNLTPATAFRLTADENRGAAQGGRELGAAAGDRAGAARGGRVRPRDGCREQPADHCGNRASVGLEPHRLAGRMPSYSRTS
jgi:hypothetical protein